MFRLKKSATFHDYCYSQIDYISNNLLTFSSEAFETVRTICEVYIPHFAHKIGLPKHHSDVLLMKRYVYSSYFVGICEYISFVVNLSPTSNKSDLEHALICGGDLLTKQELWMFPSLKSTFELLVEEIEDKLST